MKIHKRRVWPLSGKNVSMKFVRDEPWNARKNAGLKMEKMPKKLKRSLERQKKRPKARPGRSNLFHEIHIDARA
jgi:hypothetical protein